MRGEIQLGKTGEVGAGQGKGEAVSASQQQMQKNKAGQAELKKCFYFYWMK